jgi:hypothetical protein
MDTAGGRTHTPLRLLLHCASAPLLGCSRAPLRECTLTRAGSAGYSDANVANRNARGLARRDRKWPLNDGQIPNSNVARGAPGSGYHCVEGNRLRPRG